MGSARATGASIIAQRRRPGKLSGDLGLGGQLHRLDLSARADHMFPLAI
jgi:hypothetical protein